jgi:hypothetical protein
MTKTVTEGGLGAIWKGKRGSEMERLKTRPRAVHEKGFWLPKKSCSVPVSVLGELIPLQLPYWDKSIPSSSRVPNGNFCITVLQ